MDFQGAKALAVPPKKILADPFAAIVPPDVLAPCQTSLVMPQGRSARRAALHCSSGLSIGRSDPARDYRQATDELFQTTTPRADRLQPAGSSWQFARLRLQTCPSESGPGAVIPVPSQAAG